MNRLALAIATCFGCGYWPWGPGTAGSAGGVVVRTSVPSLSMTIGGGTSATGIVLSNIELAQIETTASGAITFEQFRREAHVELRKFTDAEK